MKSARFLIEDLSMMLDAIAQARQTFQNVVDEKYRQACKERPPRDEEVAKKMYGDALVSQEGYEAFSRLMNLYGCLGGQADDYLKALNTFNVVPIRPKLEPVVAEEDAA